MSSRHAVLLLIAFLTFVSGLTLLGEPPAPVRTDHYGDPLPKGARFRLGSVRLRHDPQAWDLAWQPDGLTLASYGRDHTVRLWQIPGGKQLAKWEEMKSVTFSPDGRSFACSGQEGIIRFFDVVSGKERHSFRLPKQLDVFLQAISSDGKLLAAYEWEKGIHLYAVDSGKELRFLKENSLPPRLPPLFSPDNRSLLMMTEKGVCRWSIATGAREIVLRFSEELPIIISLAFAPDGKTLAAVRGGGIGNLVTLRSWPEGKELHRLKAEDYELETLAFSPDGKLLAAGGLLGSIRLWDVATGKELRRFEEMEGTIGHLAFSPDGSLLAAACQDGGITIREVDAARVPRPLTGVGHRLAAVAMTADGRTLLTSARDGTLTLWDGRNGKRLRTLAQGDAWANSLLLAPDGSGALLLPSTDGKPLWWDMASGRRLPAFSGLSKVAAGVAFSPDSALLALGSSNGVVHLYETTKGGEIRQLRAGASAASVCRLAFAPDSRTLAASHTDGNLILWDLKTGRPRHRISAPRSDFTWQLQFSAKLQFSADGRMLAVVWEYPHLIYLFETASGQEVWRLSIQPCKIGALAFAPDNRTLAVGDMAPDEGLQVSEYAIHLWDIPTGKDIHVFRGHQRDVHTLAFSSDGTSLISGSDDTTVLCWDMTGVIHPRPTTKQLTAVRWAKLWTDLADKDAARTQRAIDELILAHNAAAPFFKKVLWPIPPVKMAHVAALIADLDHEEFSRRDNASTELAKVGELATPTLRKALKEKPSLEMRRRIEALLETLESRPLSPDALRSIRALQVLETIGTFEAQCILETLAGGAAEASLTQEAKASLQRLARRIGKP